MQKKKNPKMFNRNIKYFLLGSTIAIFAIIQYTGKYLLDGTIK